MPAVRGINALAFAREQADIGGDQMDANELAAKLAVSRKGRHPSLSNLEEQGRSSE